MQSPKRIEKIIICHVKYAQLVKEVEGCYILSEQISFLWEDALAVMVQVG